MQGRDSIVTLQSPAGRVPIKSQRARHATAADSTVTIDAHRPPRGLYSTENRGCSTVMVIAYQSPRYLTRCCPMHAPPQRVRSTCALARSAPARSG